MKGRGDFLITFLVILHQTLGISSPDDGSSQLTVGDVGHFRSRLVDEARQQFSKTFLEETSIFRQGLDLKSVGLRHSEVPTQVLLEGDLKGQDASSLSSLHLVTNTDRPLALLASDKSGLLLVRLGIKPNSNSLVVTPLITLLPPQDDLHSISASFVSNGLLFYSVVKKNTGYLRVVADAIIMDTWAPMNINYWVDVRLDKPLVHFFELAGNVYFVLGSRLYVYNLKAMYFYRLEHEMLDSKFGTSITGFRDTAGYYIVVGMKDNVESPVYVFDPMTYTLHLTQRLVTQNVTDVQHFHDFYSDKHYILLLQDHHPAKIYWFGNEQLLEWQDLAPFHGSASASFATLGLENIIAITNQSEILLLVDNLSGHYRVNHTLQVNCGTSGGGHHPSRIRPLQTLDHQKLFNTLFSSSGTRGTKVSDVLLLNDPSHLDQKYVLAYQCVTERGTALKFDILEAKEVFLPELASSTDDLLHNIDELERILDSDQYTITEMKKIIAKDSIMLSDADQTWSCPVSIEESLIVEGKLSIENLKLTAPQEEDGKTLESLVDLIGTLKSDLDSLEETTESLLYTSGNQVVTVPVNLISLNTTSITLSDEPTITKLNGITVQKLETSFLRKSKNQTIYTPIGIDELTVDNLQLLPSKDEVSNKPGLINGIQTQNLMRKSVENQVITGHHTVTNAITFGNLTNLDLINSPILINDISTANIITEGTREVNFTGAKTVTNPIKVDSLKVVELMGENFDSWSDSLVRTNSSRSQTLTGNVIIEGDLYVHENVDVDSVNGIDMKELDRNVLRVSGPAQFVEGPVIFSDDLSISGNLNCTSINNIRWNDLVDSTSNQKILSRFIIGEATVSGNLLTDDINGIDLSTEAVVQEVDQIIAGRTRFTKDVVVRGSDGVTMDRSTRINGVDPSELRALLSNVGQVIIKEEFHYEQALSFNCDINIDVLNGIVLDQLPTKYWRKNVTQTIDVDVKIPKAVFKAPLKVGTLNGLAVDQYLLLNRDQTIFGYYKFSDGLTVNGDLTMSPNTTLDGINLQELRDDVMTLDTDQIISGENEFRGGLSVAQLSLQDGGRINSVSLERVALLNKTNYFEGNVDFIGPVHADIFLAAGDIATGTFNNIFLEKQASDIVKVDETATINGDLVFNAPVQVLELTTRGTVDGVDLADLEKNALKRVSLSQQNVTGDLTVSGDTLFNGSLSVQNINGEEFIDFVQSVVTRDFGGIIKGQKTFINPVNIISDAVFGNYNGQNLDLTLSSILTRSTVQNITGDYIFANAQVGDLEVPVINNLSLDEVLLTHQSINNSMDIYFSGGVLVLELNSPSDVISGCDVKLLEKHMNWKDFKSHEIKEPLSIDSLRVTNDVASLSERIILKSILDNESGDFQEYMESFVTKSTEQIITGEVQFLGNVSIAGFNTPYINRVDVDDVVHSALRRSDLTIRCHVNFRKSVTADNLVIQGELEHPDGVLIDGVNFKNLSRYSVRKSKVDKQEILGKKIFTIGLVVVDDLRVDNLNGFPADDLVNIGPDETVDVEVIFETGIDVKGNLTVGGLLDGVSLDDVLQKRIPLVDAYLDDTNLTVEHLDIKGDLLTSAINDVLLSNLVVTGTNDTQLLTGDVTFAGGLTVDGDIEVLETLNGMNVADMSRRVAMMNRDELLEDSVVFKGEVFAPNARILGGRLSTLDFHSLHSDMTALNQTVQDDLRFLRGLLKAVLDTNEENLARVKALQSRFDYLVESDAFELQNFEEENQEKNQENQKKDQENQDEEDQDQDEDEDEEDDDQKDEEEEEEDQEDDQKKATGTFLDIAHSSLPGLNGGLTLGLSTGRCDGARIACYCRRSTQTLQVTASGKLSSSRPVPGVLELKQLPTNPGVHLELNTTCVVGELHTEFTAVNVDTAERSHTLTMSLDYVIKSKFLVTPKDGRLLLAVISEQTGSDDLLSILGVDYSLGALELQFLDYVLVPQELSDLCVAEIDGVGSVVVTGRRRSHTDGTEAATYRYEWNQSDHKLVLRDIYPGYGVTSCLMFLAPRIKSNFLLLAQEDIGRNQRDRLNSSVLAFRQSPTSSGFERYQSIGVQGAVGLEHFTIGDQLLVAMVTRTGLLYIYELHYGEGFQITEKVRLPLAHPYGVVRVGPSTIYSAVTKGHLNAVQDTDDEGNESARKGNESDRKVLLYFGNKNEVSKADQIRRLVGSGTRSGYPRLENAKNADSISTRSEFDGPLSSGIDSDREDGPGIDNRIQKLEKTDEERFLQPRFIVGHDTRSIPDLDRLEDNGKVSKDQVLFSADDNDRGDGGELVHPETSYDVEAKILNLDNRAGDFVTSEPESLRNLTYPEIRTETVLDEADTTGTPEFTVSYSYDGPGFIDVRSGSSSKSDSFIRNNSGSRKSVVGPNVPENFVIVQHPSFLAVGSSSGLVLYEIRTSGIDGERLLSEVNLFEK